MQANIPSQDTLQRKIDDSRPRTDFMLELKPPIPDSFTHTMRFLRNFVDRDSKKHSFVYSVLPGKPVVFVAEADATGKLVLREPNTGEKDVHALSTIGAIEFKSIPVELTEVMKTALEVLSGAWDRHGRSHLQTMVGEERLSIVNGQKKLPMITDRPTWKAVTTMCQGCDKYEHGWGPGCVAVSYLWGDWERNQHYVNRYRHHIDVVETEPIRRGTRMHDLLVMMRNPVEDVDRFLDRLARGERVGWMIPICAPRHGLRARPPDWVVSQLHKEGDGYKLVHIVVEDKASGNPTYWNQVWGEAIILANRNALLHRYMSGHKHDEFQSTPGVPLIEALERKLGINVGDWRAEHDQVVVEPPGPLKIPTNIDDPGPISVDVYSAINVYTNEGSKRLKNPRLPVDNYAWLMGGVKPPNVEYPRLWSRDGRVRDIKLQDRVLGIRKQRIEAYERGSALPPKKVTKRLQYRFTSSNRTDLDNLTPLDEEVSMFTTKSKK